MWPDSNSDLVDAVPVPASAPLIPLPVHRRSNAPSADKRPRAHDDATLSLTDRRTLVRVLDWQLWYWGQDIHHANGNALLAYGFDRARGPEDGTQRSSAYILRPGTTASPTLHGLSSLIAWGFGIGATHGEHARDGSLLLVRHDTSPGLCTAPLHGIAGTREQLPTREFPHTPTQWRTVRDTLTSLARCFVDYETWAHESLGASHRIESQARRPRAVRRRHAQPPFLADVWQAIANAPCSPALEHR